MALTLNKKDVLADAPIDLTINNKFRNHRKHNDLGQKENSSAEDKVFREWIEDAFAASSDERRVRPDNFEADAVYWLQKFAKVLEELLDKHASEQFDDQPDLKVDQDERDHAKDVDVAYMEDADDVLDEKEPGQEEQDAPKFLNM